MALIENYFLLVTFTLASLLSGGLTFFLKKRWHFYVISIASPLVLFSAYALFVRDEVGFWALFYVLGIVSSLIGAVFGFAVATLLKKI